MFYVQDKPFLHVFCIRGMDLSIYPGFPAQLFFLKDGRCFKSILFQPIEILDVFGNNANTIAVLQELARIDSLKLCQGIGGVQNYSQTNLRSVILSNWPYVQFRAKACSTFVAVSKKHAICCNSCIRASNNQKTAIKRKLEETPTRKLKRTRPNSKCPFSYLTPKSRRKRLQSASRMRFHFKQKILKLTEVLERRDLKLNDEQTSEMTNVAQIIEEDYSEVVEEVINSSTEKESERIAIKKL